MSRPAHALRGAARALVVGAITAWAALAPRPVAAEPELPPGATPLALRAVPVEVSGRFYGLEPAGAWRLDAADPRFGGLSGLLVGQGRLVAVSDAGRWLFARLRVEGTALTFPEAHLAPMRGADGGIFDKAGGDAEALARRDGAFAVAFERDHRVMWLGPDGRLVGTIQARAFERLPSNAGLEALATLPDGRLVAFAEARAAGMLGMFVIDAAGGVEERTLAFPDTRPVTGADVGSAGRLYLVLRRYTPVLGLSIAVLRLDPGADGLPDPASAATLAEFGGAGGIDNMEGIAVETDASGRRWLWLVSDDNFSVLQRTLLLRFRLRD